VSSSNGIDHVTLYYGTGLVGNFTSTMMYDDGNHNDSAANDGIYGADIPGQTSGTWVRFYIEAAAGNTAKSVSYLPVGAEHDVFVYLVAPVSSADKSISINEVMASNTTVFADNNGEYDDWIELYNKTNQVVNIGGYYLTDNLANLDKWEIPAGTTIAPNGYLTFWADEDSSQGWNHCNFKLSASGEFVYLLNNNMEVVDSVNFGILPSDTAYARIPNGTGSFANRHATFGFNNETSLSILDYTLNAASFSVYPNPAGNYMVVALGGLRQGHSLEMRNALGQVVHKMERAENKTLINTSELTPGIYFIRYGNITRKVVIQH
jgi:hypothetical protein